MEVLVNFEGSRRVVSVEDSLGLLVAVERELARRCPGRDVAIAPVGTKLSQSSSKEFLQKHTEKWGYVDVTDLSQVRRGDEITLTKMPKLEESTGSSHRGESSSPHQHTLAAMSKVVKPTKSEAAALGKLFPSSPSLPKLPTSFDPGSECVFAPQKRKKKSCRVKPSKLTLTLLPLGSSAIPRGKQRKVLENGGRMKKVEFSRKMSGLVVKNKIITAFAELEDFHSTYSLLLQSQDGKLTLADNQFPTGEQFVEKALKHRGNVYLTSKKEVVAGPNSSPSSSDSDLPRISVRKKSKDHSGSSASRSIPGSSASGSGGFIIPTSSSGGGGGVVAIIVPGSIASGSSGGGVPSSIVSGSGGGFSSSGSGSDGGVFPGSSSGGGSSSISATLEEWRQVRREQDAAFQESLQIDQLKDRRSADQERREQELGRKRAALRLMFASREGPVRVAFRLPHSERVSQSFLQDDLPKVLYQYVLSLDVDAPFVLKTTSQTIHYSLPVSLGDLDVDLSTLIVEKTESGPDLLQLLVDDVVVPEDTGTTLQDTGDEIAILKRGENDRREFLKALPAKATGSFHHVDRKKIHSSVIGVFSKEGVENEFPLRVSFTGERGVDIGGVYRDMLSVFWNDAYEKLFDGGCLLTPLLHPQIDLSVFPVLGKIISHGYLGSGFLPMRIAFPTLATLLLRTAEVSDSILVATFLQMVSAVEANALSKALSASSEFSASQRVQLASIFSRFGSRQLSTCHGLQQQIVQVAKFEFLIKPSAALQAISSGIPESHRPFWSALSAADFHSIYLALSASPEKVLDLLREPDVEDSNQDRVLGYLRQYIGSMKAEEIRRFLRFVSGSSVCTSEGIQVSFNKLTGAARRPIGHTCSCLLELPLSYLTYEEFTREFQAILFSEEEVWRLDGM